MRTAYVLLVLLIAAPSLLATADANPIPVPTLVIEREKISISLAKHEDALLVKVRGEYPFRNFGYRNVTMYFPVPREALKGNISVTVNGRPVRYEVAEEMLINGKEVKYETVLGPLPLLKWVVEDAPERFTVEVRYSYSVDAEDGGYVTIYALGTGRFYYSKQCRAYVTIQTLNLKGFWLWLSLAAPKGLGETTFIVQIPSDAYPFELREASPMFKGLSRDLVIRVYGKIAPPTPIPTPGEWVEGYPMSIDIEAGKAGNATKITVTMVFRHSGYRVEWLPAVIDLKSRTVRIFTRVWEWTGPSAQVVTRKSHSYNLTLEPGRYTVVVYVNGDPAYREVITADGQATEAPETNRETPIYTSPVVQACIAAAAALGALIVLLSLRSRPSLPKASAIVHREPADHYQ